MADSIDQVVVVANAVNSALDRSPILGMPGGSVCAGIALSLILIARALSASEATDAELREHLAQLLDAGFDLVAAGAVNVSTETAH